MDNSLRKHISCIAHNSSEGRLLAGDGRTAIVDCGMAFCADTTIMNIKKALNGRLLDYILLTHTHYDHVGALPYFREEWPDAQLVTSEIGAAVLLKPTPRRVIRELSAAAADLYGASASLQYCDDAFHADILVKEGDVIELGGLTAVTMETPGHTRDSLCFYIPELKMLMLNETPGVLMPDGSMYPCYLTGYRDTLNSIEKCRATDHEIISLPHRGIVEGVSVGDFYAKASQINAICYEFMSGLIDGGLGEDEIISAYAKKYFNEILGTFQPREAFEANAKAMLKCTARELAHG